MNAIDPDAPPRAPALATLAEPALPAALWPRVEARRQALFARRRRVGGVAALFAVACGVALLVPRPGTDPGDAGRMARRVDASPLPAPVVLQVRAIDRELQSAYQSGADAGEIARLWRARSALIAAGGDGGPVEPLRI